jgi:hypothetical protein
VDERRFSTTAEDGGRGRVLVPVPFDPDRVWHAKPRHHVAGTVNGMRIRAVIEARDGGWGFTLGAAWRRGCHLDPGDAVEVVVGPEGPQRDDLPADVAAALVAHPAAGAFFDALAQFYKRAYLRWIDGTKRRPELRKERIAEMVTLLQQGIKERPKQE